MMKAMTVKFLLAGLVLLFLGVGCGEGDDNSGSSSNSESPANSNNSSNPTHNNPYACPHGPEYLDYNILQGDYVLEGAEEDELFYVRVVSDSVIEVVYPEDDTGEIRVETYGVVSRTLD